MASDRIRSHPDQQIIREMRRQNSVPTPCSYRRARPNPWTSRPMRLFVLVAPHAPAPFAGAIVTVRNGLSVGQQLFRLLYRRAHGRISWIERLKLNEPYCSPGPAEVDLVQCRGHQGHDACARKTHSALRGSFSVWGAVQPAPQTGSTCRSVQATSPARSRTWSDPRHCQGPTPRDLQTWAPQDRLSWWSPRSTRWPGRD